MPIGKGEAWGEPGRLPADGVVARSDRELRALVEAARRGGEPLPVVGLLGGDLAAAVGGRGDESRLHDGTGVRLPVDVGAVRVDGEPYWFVAHLVARRSWWRGRIVAVMNTDLLGDWHVAPRAHPGDGLLDVVDADPPVSDRLRARRRLPSGAHLPHPAITTSRVRRVAFDLDPPLDVWLDGARVGRGAHVEVSVEPDALTVVV
jgi:hypothetical protein